MRKNNMKQKYNKPSYGILIKVIVGIILLVTLGILLYKFFNTSKENFNTLSDDKIELHNFPEGKDIDGDNGIFTKETNIEENGITYTKYTLKEAFELKTNTFIKILSETVIIDGNNIELDCPDNFKGLIQNGDINNNNGYSNVTIQNFKLIGGSIGWDSISGFICQDYFSRGAVNNRIQNCYTTGNILSQYSSGGICGAACGRSGKVTITNCYTTGDILGSGTGGICGSGCGFGGTVIITNCYTTGVI